MTFMITIKSIRLFTILILTLLLLTDCQARRPFFYDFENEAILDTLSWKCKTIFALSDKHATSGQKCLKMELYPSPYPGITLNNFNPDWSKHTTLKLDIHNQEKIPLRLTIRIDDTMDPSYSNRYNNTITLNPGANHISIPLNSLVTSGANNKLNLLRIERVILFLVQPKEKRTLYLDNLRLE
jgi:hypothetical protein